MVALSKTTKAGQEQIACLFRVLGNDTRMRILHDLATGEKCVCNIFKRLKLPQNLVSHHLGILRKNGLIRSRRAGKWVYYSLEGKQLAHVAAVVHGILKAPKGQPAC